MAPQRTQSTAPLVSALCAPPSHCLPPAPLYPHQTIITPNPHPHLAMPTPQLSTLTRQPPGPQERHGRALKCSSSSTPHLATSIYARPRTSISSPPTSMRLPLPCTPQQRHQHPARSAAMGTRLITRCPTAVIVEALKQRPYPTARQRGRAMHTHRQTLTHDRAHNSMAP